MQNIMNAFQFKRINWDELDELEELRKSKEDIGIVIFQICFAMSFICSKSSTLEVRTIAK